MSELKDFQRTFIELALQSHALEFGKFTLKSGRTSPYFFNAAKMLNGCDLFKLANCYVDAIEDSSMKFDCLYGPAYKGIFLGSIVATVFSQRGNPCPLSLQQHQTFQRYRRLPSEPQLSLWLSASLPIDCFSSSTVSPPLLPPPRPLLKD